MISKRNYVFTKADFQIAEIAKSLVVLNHYL